MFRLKENWRYLIRLFEEAERPGKQLRKTTDAAQYRSLTHEIHPKLPYAGKSCPGLVKILQLAPEQAGASCFAQINTLLLRT